MTIACCYVSPEGVILGADSTTSYGNATGMRHFNHNQKVYQVGSSGTLGIVTWGLAGLGELSHRTLFARLGDSIEVAGPTSVADVMDRWIDLFWPAYSAALATPQQAPLVMRCRALEAKPAFDPAAVPPAPGARTQEVENVFQQLKGGLTAGFCIGGYVLPGRDPAAQFVHFNPLLIAKPVAVPMPAIGYEFWGVPNMFQRLIRGADDDTKNSIVASGKWNGTLADLNAVLVRHNLGHPVLPLRDAVDFVYSCIFSTIKAIKFSYFPPVCGGAIELAVISTDREFRWVRHKTWDVAVADGARS